MSNSDWKTVALGEVTSESTERLGIALGQCPVYGVDRSVGITATPKYASDDLSRYKRLAPGMFAYNPMRLNIGSIGYCSASYEPGVVSPDYIVFRCDTVTLDTEYLRYYMQSEYWRKWTQGSGVGSVRVRIYYRELARMSLLLPPIAEQRAIAYILHTLDDKIELNRRMIETLEAMARAIFKSWFEDFNPVRAEAMSHDPCLPEHLAKLFPDSFENSDLGRIPQGWAIGRFGDVVEQIREQENPLSSPEVLFHHFSIPAFDEGQSPRREYGESIKSLKSRIPAGAILLSKLNPEIERVWMVDVRESERAVCSTEFLVLRGRPPFSRSYVYCLARSPAFRRQIESLVTGTSKSHQRAQVVSILNLAVIIPPPKIVAAFEQKAACLMERIFSCRRESQILASLRDSMLPKLMSGEVSVKNAVRFDKEEA